MAADGFCAAERIVISELLCYVQNNFSKCSMQGMVTAISGFFAADEIEVAKCKLYEIAKDVFTLKVHPRRALGFHSNQFDFTNTIYRIINIYAYIIHIKTFLIILHVSIF